MPMLSDILFLSIILTFFAVSMVYAMACERL